MQRRLVGVVAGPIVTSVLTSAAPGRAVEDRTSPTTRPPTCSRASPRAMPSASSRAASPAAAAGRPRGRHRRPDHPPARLHRRARRLPAREVRAHDASHGGRRLSARLSRRRRGAALPHPVPGHPRLPGGRLGECRRARDAREGLRSRGRGAAPARHESSYPEHLLSEAYRDVYTKLQMSMRPSCPTSASPSSTPTSCRCAASTTCSPSAPAAVIESVHPTSQYAYVQHMHGVRHGDPVPPEILEVHGESDIRGG